MTLLTLLAAGEVTKEEGNGFCLVRLKQQQQKQLGEQLQLDELRSTGTTSSGLTENFETFEVVTIVKVKEATVRCLMERIPVSEKYSKDLR
jgi:hypothetical protein